MKYKIIFSLYFSLFLPKSIQPAFFLSSVLAFDINLTGLVYVSLVEKKQRKVLTRIVSHNYVQYKPQMKSACFMDVCCCQWVTV